MKGFQNFENGLLERCNLLLRTKMSKSKLKPAIVYTLGNDGIQKKEHICNRKESETKAENQKVEHLQKIPNRLQLNALKTNQQNMIFNKRSTNLFEHEIQNSKSVLPEN